MPKVALLFVCAAAAYAALRPVPGQEMLADGLMLSASSRMALDYNEFVAQHTRLMISAKDHELGARVRKDLRALDGAMKMAGY